MADTAAQLVDRVLPEAPIRQWVLTLPYPLRYRCAYDSRLTSDVLRAFTRSLFSELRRRARNRWGERAEQCGAVTFIQRFGSALNLNVHFHTLALDGVYPYSPERDKIPRFLALPPPEPGEVARVLSGAARRIQRVIEARHADDEDALARDEPLLALLTAASLGTRIATGPCKGEPWRRLGDRVEPREAVDGTADPEASARVPQYGGMSLHAEVHVPARDRRRLERLCRYVARPPLASERLEECPDGRLALRLKSPWRDGTTHILMERSELIERLVPLIPPPRAHQVRYHGVLAPGASMRDRIVPGQSVQPPGCELAKRVSRCPPPAKGGSPVGPYPSSANSKGHPTGRRSGETDAEPTPAAPRHRAEGQPREPAIRERTISERGGRMRWAALLERVFEIDALRCPRCGSTMRLIAAIEDPNIARRILDCLNLPARAPPMAKVTRRPSEPPELEDDWSFDQSADGGWP